MKNLKQEKLVEAFVLDYQKYGITVNIKRSIPDIRDGLKPVQRYILYAMTKDSTGYNNTVKCASIVGEVMKKYHPHGDSSIYDALILLSRWFSEKIPLITPHGNFGNMQGDGAAAMRYTGAKLSEFTKECVLGEIKSHRTITDYRLNYDNTTQVPDYLPVSVPLLLIEGTNGIGVGKNVFIPSHNLNEVIDVVINYIKDPTIPVVLIPDECMGSDIVDTDWETICNTGHGSYKVRAVIDIEDNNLVIKTLIDSTKFDKIKESIIKLAKSSLPQIIDIDDDTDGDDLRIIIKLRKGSDPYYVREELYKKTSLQETRTVNFEVVHDINLLKLSYKAYIEFFVNFTKNKSYRLYMSKYSEIETKIHELDFYIKIMESGRVDELLQKIRNMTSINDNSFVEYLIKEYNITDVQAKYVFNISAKKLSLAYLEKYKSDLAKYLEESEKLIQLITDDKVLEQQIINDLLYIKQKYGQPRKSKVIKVSKTAEIPKGIFTVIITENNFVKKLENGIIPNKSDNPKLLLNNVDNRDSLLMFGEKGKVYKLPIHKIPLMNKSNAGIDIRVLIKGLTTNIVSIIPESVIKQNASIQDPLERNSLVILTKENKIKRIDVNDLCSVPLSGIIYSRLSVGDSIQSVILANNKFEIVVFSNKKALIYPFDSIPVYGRMASGVIAMGGTNNKIDGISIINKNDTYILVISKLGKVNKLLIDTIPVQDRTKAPSSVIKLSKEDNILIIQSALDTDKLTLETTNGLVQVPVSEIPTTSTISSGTKLVNGKPIILKARIER